MGKLRVFSMCQHHFSILILTILLFLLSPSVNYPEENPKLEHSLLSVIKLDSHPLCWDGVTVITIEIMTRYQDTLHSNCSICKVDLSMLT